MYVQKGVIPTDGMQNPLGKPNRHSCAEAEHGALIGPGYVCTCTLKESCPKMPNCLWLRQSLVVTKHMMLVTHIYSPCTHTCILSQPDTLSCGSGHPS